MNTFQNNFMYPNVLPAQQILQANGRASVNAMRMSPNSSALVADTNLPVVYKCTSDSLGNVTVEAFDISPHKDEEVVRQENILASIDQRLKRLEDNYESLIKRNSESEFEYGKANVGNVQKRKKSTNDVESDDAV